MIFQSTTRRSLPLILFVSTLQAIIPASESSGQSPATFREQIAPILLEHCVSCHGAKRSEGGYRLDAIEHMLLAGESGNPPIVAAKSAESEMLQRIRSHDPNIRMPAESEPLTSEQIASIAQWMDNGADLAGIVPSEPLWSIIPPAHYAPPPEHYANAVPVTAIAFSIDGTQLISSGYHETLVWNIADGSLSQRINNQAQRTFAIHPLRQGTWLAIAGGTPGSIGELRLVDRASGVVSQCLCRSNDVVLDIAARPGTSEIAVALADNTIRLINTDSLETRRVIASHADWVLQVAYSEDGKRLGSASRDKSAKVYDAETGELIVSYAGHAAAVRGIAAIGEGNQWMTVGSNNQWHRWEVEGSKKIAEAALGGEPAKLLKTENGAIIPCGDRHWYRIDLANNSIANKQLGHDDWVIASASHPATGLLATGGIDGTLAVWNLADGVLIRSWKARP